MADTRPDPRETVEANSIVIGTRFHSLTKFLAASALLFILRLIPNKTISITRQMQLAHGEPDKIRAPE